MLFAFNISCCTDKPQAHDSCTHSMLLLCRYVVERRMRVLTQALQVAQDPATVYEHARPDCILCLLMHKISRAAAEEGVWNARQLLQDWLVRALANYNTNTNRAGSKPGAPLQVGVLPSPTLSVHASQSIQHMLVQHVML